MRKANRYVAIGVGACIAIILMATIIPIKSTTSTTPTTPVTANSLEEPTSALSEVTTLPQTDETLVELEMTHNVDGSVSTESKTTTTTSESSTHISDITFESEEAEIVYNIIQNGKQYKEKSFKTISEFLKTAPNEDGVYKIKKNFNLILSDDRSLSMWLGIDSTTLVVYANVDVPDLMSPGHSVNIIKSYPYTSKGNVWAQVVDGMTFYEGSFYQWGEKILSVDTIPGMEEPFSLLGEYTTENNLKYFSIKSSSKIVLIQYSDGKFSGYYPIATTCVAAGEYVETDKDKEVYNEAALMNNNIIYYRSNDGKIVKLEITNNKTVNETIVSSAGEGILYLDSEEILVK